MIKQSNLKGISPLIASVIIIGITLTIATFVVPWAYDLAVSTSNTTTTEANKQIKCQNAGFDFDSGYGTYGVTSNFTGTGGADTMSVKIKNTGTINLYNFSIEVEINTSEIFEFAINSTYQKTPSNPLKPGRTAVLHALVNVDVNGTLTEARVVNDVCQQIYIKQSF
ncbi:MAG: hypothetical protein KKB03_00725 [Nanoarchaeota archaeon]|nr:hypothetical protein [Nanoarchaeota archaeon]MBU1135533.1 hypothetical protein [Nanoarchaeota archaeon]MBU2519753.1 hypothetical protein [Nanoarchaeota archaeon]